MNLQRYAKAIAAGTGAVSIAVADGLLDANDFITITLTVLAAIGVYVVPNKEQ